MPPVRLDRKAVYSRTRIQHSGSSSHTSVSDLAITEEDMARELADAEEAGCEVIWGDDNHLLMDFDDEKQVVHYKAWRIELLRYFGPIREEWWESSSGMPHQHCRIRIAPKLPAASRVALQGILGSDPLRTLLSVVRLEHNIPEPNRLFRPKGAVIQVWPEVDPFASVPRVDTI